MSTRFVTLLRKELSQAIPTSLLFLGAMLAWYVFLVSRSGVWPLEQLFVLSFLPLGFVPMWMLWRTYYSFRQEWTGDHMYLLLSLPVPGWYITSAKLIAAFLESAAYAALMGGGVWYILRAAGLDVVGQTFGNMADMHLPAEWWSIVAGLIIRAVIAMVVGLGALAVITQFAYLAGRLVSRFQGVLSVWVFLLTCWATFRVGALLGPWLNWLPPFKVSGIEMSAAEVLFPTVYLSSGPIVAALAVPLLAFLVGSWLLERDIEL